MSYRSIMGKQISPEPSVALVIVLWAAGLGAAMQFAKISVTFPFIREVYFDAGSEVGLLVSLIGFLGIGLGLFAGLIVANFGPRRLLLFALLLGALMSLFQMALPSFYWMLFWRVIEGISHLIIVVAAPTLIAQASSDHYRPLAMTLWSTFFGVGFALVAWFGIPLVESQGLSALFAAHAIFMAATALMLKVLFPFQKPREKTPLNLNLAGIIWEHVQTYRSPFVAAPAFGWLFYTLTFVSLLTVLPDLVPAEDRSFVAGAMPLASIAVSLFCGVFILPRVSTIGTIMLGFGLAIIVISFLLFSSNISWACIALFGVLGLVQSASFAAIPQLNKDAGAQARANGAMAQMGNLGNTIGTPLLLLLLVSFGLKGLIWGVAGCYILAIGAHLLLKQRRQSYIPN